MTVSRSIHVSANANHLLVPFLHALSPHLCLLLSLQPRCETFSNLIPQENSGAQITAQNLFHLEASGQLTTPLCVSYWTANLTFGILILVSAMFKQM